jgi:hypothetical protein
MEWSMKSAGARFLAGVGLLAFALAALASPPQSQRGTAGVPIAEKAVRAGPAIRQVAPACAHDSEEPDDYGHHGHGRGHGHHHGKPPHKGHD